MSFEIDSITQTQLEDNTKITELSRILGIDIEGGIRMIDGAINPEEEATLLIREQIIPRVCENINVIGVGLIFASHGGRSLTVDELGQMKDVAKENNDPLLADFFRGEIEHVNKKGTKLYDGVSLW